MRTLVLVNGPPGCGKDTFAAMVAAKLPRTRVDKFATYLKELTHRVFELSVPSNAFEGIKDTPNARFWGVTPRQAYIALSEKFIKPLLGEDFFGRYVSQKFRMDRGSETFVISDSGFPEEAAALIEDFGLEHSVLVRMYRKGCSFKNDSRFYWPAPAGLRVMEVKNDGSLADLTKTVSEFLEEWRKPVEVRRRVRTADG